MVITATQISFWPDFRQELQQSSWSERVVMVSLVLSAASCAIGISLAQIFLAAAAVAGLAGGIGNWWRRFKPVPLFVWPVAGFMIWSLLSALVSEEPRLSVAHLKKLLLFVLIPLVIAFLRTPARRLLAALLIFTTMGISAVEGIRQQLMLPYNPLQRIHGLMSHHMTFSNQLMIVSLALLVFLLIHPVRRSRLLIPLLAVLGLSLTALVLSGTRSAWLGFSAGLLTALFLYRPRWCLVLPVLAGLAFLFSPAAIRDRFTHILDTREAGNAARLDMLKVGWRIVRDRPFFGVGPRLIDHNVYRYGADPEIKPDFYQHLHNNIMQIAAERGVPALLLWFWFIGQLLAGFLRGVFRKNHLPPESLTWQAIGMCCLLAFLVSGLFEYSFGDSEVLMIFLIFSCLPYAADPVRSFTPDHAPA